MEDDSTAYVCPRCGSDVAERFYGPCTGCREALVASQHSVPAGSTATQHFEPRANVVPNHVATRD
ncbi:MAG TPA: hypothetical protein VG184_05120 [Acidimicrobiales bacterium]|nr:hypothetical protein [Acidimicrobiales bacterium]